MEPKGERVSLLHHMSDALIWPNTPWSTHPIAAMLQSVPSTGSLQYLSLISDTLMDNVTFHSALTALLQEPHWMGGSKIQS